MDFKKRFELLGQHLLPQRIEKIEKTLLSRTRYIKVVLEDIFYTQNISAVVRSCECMGVQDIHLIGKDKRSKINRNVAQGALQWVTLYQETKKTKEEILTKLKTDGYRLVATVLREEAVPLYDFDIEKGKVALIMGAENKGISPLMEEMADEFVTIPMGGFSDSFNISVSTAICLYEFMKKLKASPIDWELSEEEKWKLRYLWTKKSLRRSDQIEREHEVRMSHPNDQDLKRSRTSSVSEITSR